MDVKKLIKQLRLRQRDQQVIEHFSGTTTIPASQEWEICQAAATALESLAADKERLTAEKCEREDWARQWHNAVEVAATILEMPRACPSPTEFMEYVQVRDRELRARAALAEKSAEEMRADAERYQVVFGDDLGTMREPLMNARTGEPIHGRVRWTIWWDGPDKPLVRDAIDHARSLLSHPTERP